MPRTWFRHLEVNHTISAAYLHEPISPTTSIADSHSLSSIVSGDPSLPPISDKIASTPKRYKTESVGKRCLKKNSLHSLPSSFWNLDHKFEISLGHVLSTHAWESSKNVHQLCCVYSHLEQLVAISTKQQASQLIHT